jgi:hypothetical protein
MKTGNYTAIIAIIGFMAVFAACGGGGTDGSTGGDQYEEIWYNPWVDPNDPDDNSTGTDNNETGEQTPRSDSVPGNTLAEQLAWLQSNAQSDTAYTLTVNADEDLAYHPLQYLGKSNISITLIGNGSEKVIRSTSSNLFYVANDITLILDKNITLQGGGVLIYGGTLVINAGAKIIGNTGSGVSMRSGTFTMEGGEISGNTGSGVVNESGIFIMNGGEIYGNTGAGVHGSITMNGGEISGNTGAGVVGSIIMNGGEIYGNTGTGVMTGSGIMNNGKIYGNMGGGVNIGGERGATFTMNDGEIMDNITEGHGGGVSMSNKLGSSNDREGKTFTMNGGKISGNTACQGGGVYLGDINTNISGRFIMNGGEISGNTANRLDYGNGLYGGGLGGGVCGGITSISGGIIYGSNADTGKANIATGDSNGAALYGTARYGTGSTWTYIVGSSSDFTRKTTIRVVNGVLQP